MEENSIRRLLLSLLCSLMIALSLPSKNLFANIGSVPSLENILNSVTNSGWAGVAQLPSASDVPKVVSPQTVANGSEPKNKEDQEPLKDVALVGLTFGREVTFSPKMSRLMGLTSGDTAPSAKILMINPPDSEIDMLYVIQNGNGNGNSTYIIIAYRTQNEGTFCLTSLDGKLKSAVFAKKGQEPALVPIEQEAKKFESKKQWWINKAKELNQQSSGQR